MTPTKTTNRLIKGVTVIVALLLLTVALYACDKPTVPDPDVEYVLNALCENFENQSSVYIQGNVARDGVIDTKISGTLNDTDKQINLCVNDEDRLYASKYLLKGNAGTVTVEKANTSYNATLSLIPFSIYNFNYNKNFVGGIEKADNHILISFLPSGIKKVFDTTANVSGGVFSISYVGKRITETVLTTTLTENGKEIRYSAHYFYSEGGKAFDKLPWVSPTNSLDYASYALTQIAATHDGQTLRSAGSDRDTKVTMDALCADFQKIDGVHVIEAGGAFSLGITYSSSVQILGLGSVDELEIIYGKDYRAVSVVVNKGTKYVVK